MNQITSKHPSATARVHQALAAGAHQICAEDVAEMLKEIPSDEPFISLLEDTANLLAGMLFDMTIPAHARECMSAKVEALNNAIDAMTDR